MLSLFDRLWHKDISEEEAVRLMEKGIEEVKASCSSWHNVLFRNLFSGQVI